MSLSSDEEIVDIIYTEMYQRSVPCYASDLCDRMPGLKKRQDTVIRLLQTMCDNDIAVKVRGKYILKENMRPDLALENESSLTCDGPTYGTTCSSNEMTGLARSEPVNVQAGELGLARAGSVNIQPGDMVPVQHSAIQRSTSSNSTCNNKEVELYTGAFDKILDILKRSSGAIKAKDIAQQTGLGKSRSDVNRYLYFLKQQNIINDNGKAEWTFVRDVNRDDLKIYAAQLAKTPGGKSTKTQQDAANGRCDCKNAGPGCVHVTNNFAQHNHYHHHYTQIGDQNRMMDDEPPDDRSPRGSQR